MEFPNEQQQGNIVNSLSNTQIDRKVLNTVLVTNALDPKAETECRICQDEEISEALITPCTCTGSMAHVHQSCLKTWIKEMSSLNQKSCGPPKCEVCHSKFLINHKMKLRISRFPEITAKDKLRHALFCVSIFLLFPCMSIGFVVVANMHNRTKNSNISTSYETNDILLVVFGVALFVAVFVALVSQRYASLSVIQVAKIFFRNSKEWTVSSINKHGDVIAGAVV